MSSSSRARIRKYVFFYNRPDIAGYIFTPESKVGREPLAGLPVFFDFQVNSETHHVQIASTIHSFRDRLGLQAEFGLQLSKFEPGFRRAFRKILPDLFLTYGTIRGAQIQTAPVLDEDNQRHVLYFPIFSFTLTETNPYSLSLEQN